MARTVIPDRWLLLLLFTGCVSTVLCCAPGYTGQYCKKFDYAYLKTADQMGWQFSSDYVKPPYLAVSGNDSMCSRTDLLTNPWWSVDMHNLYYIEGVVITPPAGDALAHFKNFTVEWSSDGPWHLCYSRDETYAPTSPISVQCASPPLARNIKVTVYSGSLDVALNLCDVGVYGDCNDGDFGNYCNNTCGECFNETICQKQDGYCPPFGKCEAGFVSPFCLQKCPFGKYSDACHSTCGSCRNNATCNVFNGHCPSLGACQDDSGCPELDPCEPGYKEPLCQAECDSYFYGYGCQPCGACTYSDICDKISGTCPRDCKEGYKNTLNPLCTIPCDDGTFGKSCAGYCGHCWNATRQHSVPCNKVTGLCDDTCAPGYKKSNTCHDQCEWGSYGENCQGTCGECGRHENGTVESVPCVPEDGTCATGCMMGWEGAGCKDRCVKGTWARNCVNVCTHCDDCDALTGVCVKGTCKRGWEGDLCDQECPDGRYGQYCGHQCPANCVDQLSCNKADGSCYCKVGWTGLLCLEKCPTHHWGDSCSQQCGHCANNENCRQSDGDCLHGCQQDWEGSQCISIVAPSEYKQDYGAIIGGVIGGLIGLVLIAILVAYIVWSWRTGTPMNPQEFVRAARMSLRASQKFARSSIDRLSMRRRRQQQERQKLAKAGVQEIHIADIEITDTAGAINKRIYDSVGLPCNNIQADDFQAIYLQLQEVDGQGRTALYSAFQSFLRLLTDAKTDQSGLENKAYYNGGNDVQLQAADTGDVPKFLPLGSNLSGFLLVQSSVSSETIWRHVQQRQIETVITMGKMASVTWRPRERVTIGNDTIECVDVKPMSSHTESKLTIRKMNAEARRAIHHYEVTLWDGNRFPNVSTLLMFMDRFQQISSARRGRSVLVNYVNQQEQSVVFTIIASAMALMRETDRVDILRAVNMGGTAATKAMRTFENFKYLHDVFFHHIAMQITKRSPAPAIMRDTTI